MQQRIFTAFNDALPLALEVISSLLQRLPFFFDQWLDFLLLELFVELSESLFVLRYFQVLDLLISLLLQSCLID